MNEQQWLTPEECAAESLRQNLELSRIFRGEREPDKAPCDCEYERLFGLDSFLRYGP